MQPIKIENLAAFGIKGVKRAAAKERGSIRVFLCSRTIKVEVKGKVIPTSFLKIEGRRTFGWDERPEKEGQLVELVGDQNQSTEAPSRSKRGRESRKQKIRAIARGAMMKSRYVGVIKGKVTSDDPITYFSLQDQKYLLSPRGSDSIWSPPEWRDFWERKNGKREKKSVLLSVEEKRMGSINIKKKEAMQCEKMQRIYPPQWENKMRLVSRTKLWFIHVRLL